MMGASIGTFSDTAVLPRRTLIFLKARVGIARRLRFPARRDNAIQRRNRADGGSGMNDKQAPEGAGPPPDGAPQRVSDMLARLIGSGMPETISLGWVTERLQERSFGAYFLTMAMVAVLPFVSIPVGALIAVFAIQLVIGWESPIVPAVIARRPIPAQRFAALLKRTISKVTYLERFTYPRWHVLFRARRTIGLVIFLLALTLLIPIPFSNVVPAIAIALVALAYLERDGALLSIGLAAAAASLAFAAFLVWGLIRVAL